MLSKDRDRSLQEPGAPTIGRRSVLLGLGTWMLVGCGRATRAADSPPTGQPAAALVAIEQFAASGKSEGILHVPRVVKSEAEWRAQLSPLAYNVARQAGTEIAFTGEYDGNHAIGIYRCICCDTALFDSRTKYDSGTGWPSFWQAISRLNVSRNVDYLIGVGRDAISCRRCDAHLGHVFGDGPPPTGLRYCMNSVSLHFAPRA